MGIQPNTADALHQGHAGGARFLRAAISALAQTRNRGTVLLVATLMALVVVTKFSHTVHTDVAWYVYSAGAFLDGGHLYDDVFFEMNPPLMLYLTLPGVMLARSTGLFAVNGYLLTIFAAVGFSLWLGARMLPARHRLIWSILFFFTLVVLPAGDFGGRVAKVVEIGGACSEAWWSGSGGEVKVGG